MKKTIVILANSVKHGQHCVAGKDIVTKQWIRPVKDPNGSELTHEQARCRNPYGVFPISVLQKVEMGFLRKAPLINQPENFIITNEIWSQAYKMDRNELHSYLDSPEILWSNESSSSNGENDRVNYDEITNGNIVIEQSLYLIKPKSTKILISINIENKRRVRISFLYKNIVYNLATTDPVVWKEFSNKGVGEYQFDVSKFLCISLAEKYDDGYCYKLVASVL